MRNLAFLWLSGCATYRYAASFSPGAAELADIQIDVKFEDAHGTGVGMLSVSNHGPTRVFLVWDHLSTTTQAGSQKRAYKGDQTVAMQEMSIPDQPIEPGAYLTQSIATGRAYVREAQRPATAMDWGTWPLLLGFGTVIENARWRPGPMEYDRFLPGWQSAGYSLLVPIRVGDQEHVLTVDLPAVTVDARRERY